MIDPQDPGLNQLETKARQGLAQVRRLLRQGASWLHFRWRRIFSKTQTMAAGYHSTGPLAYLLTTGAIGVATILTALYTTSYTVSIDGLNMGVVQDHNVVLLAMDAVQTQGQEILGMDYQLESQIHFEFGMNLKSELSDSSAVEHYLYQQLDELGQALARYQVVLEGKPLAIIQDPQTLDQVLEEIQASYQTEDTIATEFVEDITLEVVYQGTETSQEALLALLTENTTGETVYTVQLGDTFNVIAYNNDMTSQELSLLNPESDPNKIFVGDQLQVKETIPLLSVLTTEEVEYTQEIPCPVEEVEDNTIYIGTSQIRSTGTPGEELVVAQVHILNGVEQEREIMETTVLQAATTTIKAVGTLERPKTASYGNYIWPTSGRISSYFGPRVLNGSSGYHSGLDIATGYGTAIIAADGGTVTFAGWRGGYGNLVILTHDNGTQTYYAHCSSISASVGQKVYRGQTIAKVGSTGNSTGNHLHFEVRVGGQAVNPMGYLP